MNHPEQDQPAPADFTFNLNRMAIIAAVLSSLIALTGAWLLLPYRVEAVERRTTVVETKLDYQQQLLIRIDENVKQLKEQRHP